VRLPRHLIVLNAGLLTAAAISVGYVVLELRAPTPPRAPRVAPPAPPAATAAAPAREAPGSYTIVTTRNLFSPTRSQAPVSASAAAPALPKPNLYGIILGDGPPVAYLEDPTTKRVAGYRLGDAVAGGTVKQIGADHVVLNRPEGDVSVRLRDPSKPRPPAAPATGQPGTVAPGVVPPRVPPQQSGQVLTPPALGQSPTVLPRRPLPPNLLRRLPPSASDAPAQQ
jgi:hypothetical protein